MPYSSNMRGPSQVKRTLNRDAALKAIKFESTSKEAGTALLGRLRLRHKLRSSIVNGVARYNRSELTEAYAEHKQKCGDSPVCFPDRFAPKPPKPKAATLTVRVYEFIQSCPDQQFVGTMKQLGGELKLTVNQVQGALQSLIKKESLERTDNGWRVKRPDRAD